MINLPEPEPWPSAAVEPDMTPANDGSSWEDLTAYAYTEHPDRLIVITNANLNQYRYALQVRDRGIDLKYEPQNIEQVLRSFGFVAMTGSPLESRGSDDVSPGFTSRWPKQGMCKILGVEFGSAWVSAGMEIEYGDRICIEAFESPDADGKYVKAYKFDGSQTGVIILGYATGSFHVAEQVTFSTKDPFWSEVGL